MYLPLVATSPYPNFENINQDLKSASVIMPIYSGAHSEVNMAMQYLFHYFNLKTKTEKRISDTLVTIALSEINHIKILEKLLLRLGVNQVSNTFPLYKNDFCNGSIEFYGGNVKKIILDIISSELVAINQYEKIIKQLDNDGVCAVISRIKMDEDGNLY